jgi:hypothetical protein
LDELKAETVNEKALTKDLEGQVQEQRLWFVISIVLTLAGIIMITVGFRLWYIRVQVFQDAILRKQASVD